MRLGKFFLLAILMFLYPTYSAEIKKKSKKIQTKVNKEQVDFYVIEKVKDNFVITTTGKKIKIDKNTYRLKRKPKIIEIHLKNNKIDRIILR